MDGGSVMDCHRTELVNLPKLTLQSKKLEAALDKLYISAHTIRKCTHPMNRGDIF